MQKRERMSWEDWMCFAWRPLFLVAAIHTSPLEDISAGADFFLTRILARIAVPFFFMVTGQFVLGGFGVASHVKKLALMYGGAVLLYLPIGIYAGHYEDIGIWGLLRMLLVDGTFYHLWYFSRMYSGNRCGVPASAHAA